MKYKEYYKKSNTFGIEVVETEVSDEGTTVAAGTSGSLGGNNDSIRQIWIQHLMFYTTSGSS